MLSRSMPLTNWTVFLTLVGVLVAYALVDSYWRPNAIRNSGQNLRSFVRFTVPGSIPWKSSIQWWRAMTKRAFTSRSWMIMCFSGGKENCAAHAKLTSSSWRPTRLAGA